MKNKFFIKVLLLMCMAFFVSLPCVSAAFPEKPAGFAVLDRSGNVTNEVYKIWREPVRWAYHFPEFKLIKDNTPTKVAAEVLASKQGKIKIDEAIMKEIAEKIPAEALVLVMVDALDERIITGFGGFRDDFGETYVETIIKAQIYVYRVSENKFLKKRIYEREIEPLGNHEDPVDFMKWAICKQVNTLEGRPIIE